MALVPTLNTNDCKTHHETFSLNCYRSIYVSLNLAMFLSDSYRFHVGGMEEGQCAHPEG